MRCSLPKVNKNQFDAIVVGGGPAGSTAAYYLAESRSFDVLVVDSSSFPRHKACGGALNRCRDWAAEFRNYAEVEAELGGHPHEDMNFCVDRSVWWKGSGTHFLDHVHRYDFDNLLLQAALNKPRVSFRLFKVSSLERLEDGRIRLSDGADSLEARVVIGADGASSLISKALGNPERSRNELGVGFEHHIVCDKPHERTFIFYLWAGDPGFCWLFPANDGYYVGAGFLGPARERVKQHLSDVMTYCIEQGLLPKTHQLHRTFGGLVPTTVVDNVANDGILLVGDAAGLVSQLSGEGIYYAMKSGQIAGSILAGGIEQAAPRYRQAVRPLLKEVTYLKTIRPRLLHGVLRGYFGLVNLSGCLSLAPRLRRPFINRVFRRRDLFEGSCYEELR
jgi:geranylgeranyl reductase family protein